MEKMCDELVQKWKIDDVEDLTAIKIDDITQFKTKRFWLVGRLLTEKSFSKASFRFTMKRIWNTKEEVFISDWEGSDRFLFSFRNEYDRRQVLRGSPWSFDNTLLVLSSTNGKSNPMATPLETQNFWIRVRGLPPCLLSRAMGKMIGSILGTFVDIDLTRSGDCTGSFLNLRIGLNISKPLRRWIKLDIGDEGESKLGLEYEDLPFFCFFCGRLTHVSSGCPLAKEGLITEHQYGRWKTLAKNIFCIDPCGQLTGVSLGLTKKKAGWRMTAPEPSLSGHVRTRGEMELVEAPSPTDMVVDRVDVEDSLMLSKRRRVELTDMMEAPSKPVPCNYLFPTPIPSGNTQSASPGSHDFLSLENVSGVNLVLSKIGGMGGSTGWPILNSSSLNVGGSNEDYAGSILDFQNPLGLPQPIPTEPSVMVPGGNKFVKFMGLTYLLE